MPPGMGDAKSISEPDRVSGTNVQVIGIDEPDIVKTNGEEIFFSGEDFYVRGLEEREMIMPPEGFGKTRIINAFPPADLSVAKTIDERGEMLLHNDTLILFSGGGVKGYDVSSPQSPEKTWTVQLGENNAITASRLYDGSLYIITREQINVPRPCPMEPLIINEKALEVLCTDVYHPVNAIPTDITYHAFKINPLSAATDQVCAKDAELFNSSPRNRMFPHR